MSTYTSSTAAQRIPSVGRIVHYVSYGTPGGEFGSECRAAIIAGLPTEKSEIDAGLMDLVVFNPQGIYHNRVPYDSSPKAKGGTWHWPEWVG